MRLIALTRGKFAQVDDEDYEYLNQFKWNAHKHPSGTTYYATRGPLRSKGESKNVKMHRAILWLTDPNIIVDHKDRNGLNNQRSNIRTATQSQNQFNKIGRGSSKYRGVYYHKKNRRWASQINIDKKRVYIGIFTKEEDAAKAYDEKAKEFHGEFANLNFK